MTIFSIPCSADVFRAKLESMRPRLYRMAYSWSHNVAIADDIVQDTLIKALKGIGDLRDPAQLHSWLFAILANCWHDHFRKHREMDDIDELEDFHCAHEVTPEDEHARSQLVVRVRNAVAKLPIAQRQVLMLVDLEEFAYAEVAAILAIPVGTVMSRLCRARQTLKQLLSELAPQSVPATHLRRVV